MPADAWRMDRISERPFHVFGFTRPLTPLDWEPVLKRSVLVKYLEQYSYPISIQLGEGSMEAIRLCPPPSTLLPRLRRLITINPSRLDIFFDIPLVSSVTTLIVPGEWPSSVGFARVAAACPALECFCCSSYDRTPSWAPELANALAGWRALTGVSLSIGEHSLPLVLSSMAYLPMLSSLTLCRTSIDVSQGNLTLPPESFPSIQRLMLQGFKLSAASTILCSWSMRAIGMLTIEPASNGSPEDFLHTMRCIRDHCDPLELYELTVVYKKRIIGGWPLCLDYLTSLSCFANMEDVKISGPAESDIDDAACAQLAKWWPNLDTLSIGSHVRHLDRRPCTLTALTSLATNCPHLSRLTLPMTAVVVPPVDITAELVEIRHNSLAYLNVGDAPIDDPAAVALFLSAVVPNLVDVEYEGYDINDDDDDEAAEDGRAWETKERERKWATVSDLLPLMRKKEMQMWDLSRVYYGSLLPGFDHSLIQAEGESAL